VGPDVVVEHKLAQTGQDLYGSVNNHRFFKARKGFGNVDRQRSRMIAVHVRYNDVMNSTNLARGEGESDTAAVDREPVFYNERRQTLKLGFAPGATRQKSYSHAHRLLFSATLKKLYHHRSS